MRLVWKVICFEMFRALGVPPSYEISTSYMTAMSRIWSVRLVVQLMSNILR